MPDIRFFEPLGPLSLREIAEKAGATLSNPAAGAAMFDEVAPLAEAGPASVSFFADRRYLADLAATRAGACFLTAALADQAPEGCVALVCDEPQIAHVATAHLLHRVRRHDGSAAIHPDASVAAGCMIGPGVVIGPGAEIGSGTLIEANAVIGPGVVIGADCEIGPGVSIGFSLLGDRVKISSNSVVGQAGFGVAPGRAGLVDIPQLGRVILGDDVSVGSCTCIDRGASGDTVIGAGSKLDNLVQIAHNVRMGRSCVVAGAAGVAGSVQIGDGVQVGGSVGIADHVKIGSGVRIAGNSGIMHDIPDGETWMGSPAKPMRRYMREVAWLANAVEKR